MPAPSAETAYLFRHALLRDAAYQLHLPGERARLHALALELMEQALLHQGAIPDFAAAELAEHARIASEGVADARRDQLLRREHDYLCRAARHAQQGVNYPVAVELFKRALGYARLDALRRAELGSELAAAMMHAGRITHAVEECLRLLEQGRGQELGVLKGRILHVLGLALCDAGRAPEGLDALAQGAEILLAASDFERAGVCLASLAAQWTNAGEGIRSRAAYERALALAEEHDLLAVKRAVFPGLAVLLHRGGESEKAEAMLRESLEIARRAGASDISRELNHLYLVYQATGRIAPARECITSAMDIGRRMGNQRVEALALGNLANLEALAGDLDLAESHYRRAYAMHEETGNLRSQASLLSRMAALQSARGNVELALKQTVHAARMARRTTTVDFEKVALCNLGTYAQELGLIPASAHCYRSAIALAEAASDRIFAVCASAQLACTLLLMGEYDKARAMSEEANASMGVEQSAVWRLSDVLPARVRTLCAGWIRPDACLSESASVELARRAVAEMRHLAEQTGTGNSSVEQDRIVRHQELVEEAAAALAERRKPMIFRGHRPQEWKAATRATIVDWLRVREPHTLASLAAELPELFEALTAGIDVLTPRDWSLEDLLEDE